ncbi:putative DD41D transposase [Trichonephila clavipes]|uniref:Putative DD41D transposase n=1 Tax=Trichonephila clavipes TaxID=2585209 RepID=A0A8X6SVW7_TRICX|nr:putative DD41D transposase [Trichonephila clavipes]
MESSLRSGVFRRYHVPVEEGKSISSSFVKSTAKVCEICKYPIVSIFRTRRKKTYSKMINGDRYRAMINKFYIPELNNHDVQELWFQHDGATCHTAPAPIDLLRDTFGDRLISRFRPVNWPPRSCDLTPLDYFV